MFEGVGDGREVASGVSVATVELGIDSRPVVASGVTEQEEIETPTCEVDGMMDIESFVFKDDGVNIKEKEEEMREGVTKEERDKDDEGEREE